ncbi:MAG: thymidine phosphorylase [Planctomycetota bacterium]
MQHHPARLNQKKRDGGVLTAAEIQDLVGGVVDGSLGDAQLGAFLMAVCIRGMDPTETAALTLAMRDSGRVLARRGDRPRVDKHSTGGVGDKASLLLAPLVAACGVHVPMISGRGLGHTGGTIDKLEAIPGYRTSLDAATFDRVLDDCGFAMVQASAEIAPADRRMYATRDVSGTVESIPLITSSILSKKLAETLDGLVMDVKVGRAAFMQKEQDADRLLQSLVDVGGAAGLRVSALRTDMDHPLGLALGNALEVEEIIAAARGQGPADLVDLVLALGAEMLLLAGVDTELAAARVRLEGKLADGSALRLLQQNIERQGGDPRVVDDPARLGAAPHRVAVTAARAGVVADVDPLALGHAIVDLGGGRRQPGDPVDPQVGIVLACGRGDRMGAGELLATVHARTASDAAGAAAVVQAAMPVADSAKPRAPLVQRRVAAIR